MYAFQWIKLVFEVYIFMPSSYVCMWRSVNETHMNCWFLNTKHLFTFFMCERVRRCGSCNTITHNVHNKTKNKTRFCSLFNYRKVFKTICPTPSLLETSIFAWWNKIGDRHCKIHHPWDSHLANGSSSCLKLYLPGVIWYLPKQVTFINAFQIIFVHQYVQLSFMIWV